MILNEEDRNAIEDGCEMMTDLEINKALALAIGWPRKDVLTHEPYSTEVRVWFEREWMPFDYQDWATISPIAERYGAFPMRSCEPGQWLATFDGHGMGVVYADTPQKAIALAVIGARK